MSEDNGSRIKVYSPEEQRSLLANHAARGVWRSIAMLGRKKDAIIDLMLERTMTLGHAQYGDEMFHQTRDRIDRESMEEAADMVAREAVYDMIESGVIKEGDIGE